MPVWTQQQRRGEREDSSILKKEGEGLLSCLCKKILTKIPQFSNSEHFRNKRYLPSIISWVTKSFHLRRSIDKFRKSFIFFTFARTFAIFCTMRDREGGGGRRNPRWRPSPPVAEKEENWRGESSAYLPPLKKLRDSGSGPGESLRRGRIVVLSGGEKEWERWRRVIRGKSWEEEKGGGRREKGFMHWALAKWITMC